MTYARRLQRAASRPQSTGTDDDTPVDLATYVYLDATNTGLAGVGLTEDDLTVYSGPTLVVQDNGPFVVENAIINQDVRFNTTGSVTLRKCKLNGHIDASVSGATIIIEDCDIDAGTYSNAAISMGGSVNSRVSRCHIQGGEAAVFVGDNSVVEDCYVHGQYVAPGEATHTGGITAFGADGAIIRHCTILNDSIDNDAGGGPTADFEIFGDFAPNNNILTEYCYIPATAGGYAVSLGYNPSKPYGTNPTNIVFRHNIFGRGTNGKGGAFGTVTSWLDDAGDGVTGVGNLYYDNIWQDTGDPVPANL